MILNIVIENVNEMKRNMIYPMNGFFETIWLTAVHLQVPQPIVISRIHHRTKNRVSHVGSETQTALQNTVRCVDLRKKKRNIVEIIENDQLIMINYHY